MKNFAHLKPESPFFSIFERGMVPVKNIMVPNQVKLIGSDETEAYMLDWEKCSPAQRLTIAETVTARLGGHCDEFVAHMDKGGDMPIRVSQTTGCSTDVPFFL